MSKNPASGTVRYVEEGLECSDVSIKCAPSKGYDIQNGALRMIREIGPAHYLDKIKSFSSICTPDYDLGIFDAGGFKWRLSLYPNGNKDMDAENFISVYLSIVETQSLCPNWEVYATLKFFIHDQTRDKYLAVEDLEGPMRHFDDASRVWGLSRLISLDEFNDPSNGYLVGDSCSFGVEVFVVKTGNCLLKQPVAENTYTWKIPNFSTMTDLLYYSEPFTISGVKWMLMLYPNGTTVKPSGYMSIFLSLHAPEYFATDASCYVDYRIRLYNQYKAPDIVQNQGFTFKSTTWISGFESFITLTELNDKNMGYMKDDTLILQLAFRSTALSRNYPIS